MDFYQANTIENWTLVILMEHYHLKKKLKDKKQILDSIKKDLEEVEDSISFDMVKKGKAREILDNWKKWTAPVKNLKQDCEHSNIGYLQVKQINQLVTGSGATTYNDIHITSGKRFRDMIDEQANTKKRNVTNVDNSDDMITPRKCSSNKVDKPSENNVSSNDDPNEAIEFENDELNELEQQITSGSLNEWDIGTVNVS
ncbi:hypothetical protein C2G38_2186920 [Gigaspora rosea]|uniref:Uncharacterized protein n=1 Tax=Gigaspora rosea TaxID=44941 RepID=A0A397V9J4_9GLOM|nr:hypothetical protein C2G38_2186920 [Gigaspora rosea]